MILLCGYDDTRADWLRTGEALSALWLRATLTGLSVVPLSQVIEVEETRSALQHEVLRGLAVPHLLVRLGWEALAGAGSTTQPDARSTRCSSSPEPGSRVLACPQTLEATQPSSSEAPAPTDGVVLYSVRARLARRRHPVSDDYGSRDSRFRGRVNWVQIDIDEAAEDLDHLITAEERFRVAIARQ